MYYHYNDIDLYYEKYGNKNTNIVILPGWGDNRNTFKYMIDFLKEYATIYIIDYPGFGNSSFPSYDLTIYDYTNMIYEWIKDTNINNPILIGHSFGGRIITTLLGYYKYDFKNVIYLNSAGILPKVKIKTRVYKILKKIGFILPKKIRNKYHKFLFSKFASNDYLNLNDNMRNTFKNIVSTDLTYYLNNIKSNVLIIWGNKDFITPIRDAKIMHKRIKDSELIILDNANHFSYLNYPILINNIIYEQIKDIL